MEPLRALPGCPTIPRWMCRSITIVELLHEELVDSFGIVKVHYKRDEEPMSAPALNKHTGHRANENAPETEQAQV